MAISSFLARKSALCPNYRIGSDGWTVFAPSADTSGLSMSNAGYTGSRIIYVSTSDGNNSNDGYSPATPKLTLYGASGANTLMRNGFPDWCLFKRTDTFQGGWATLGTGNISTWGRSRYEPQLYGAYGPNASASRPFGDETGARPIFVPALGFNSAESILGGQSIRPGDVVYKSLEIYDFRNDKANANTGIIVFRGSITSGTNQITGVTNFGNLTNGMKVMGPGTRGLTVSSFDSVGGTITLSGTVNIPVSNALYHAGFSQTTGIVHLGHTGLTYVEDCFFHHSTLSLQCLGGPSTNFSDPYNWSADTQVIIRRNVFWYPNALAGTAVCLFVGDLPAQTYPTLVEENIFINGGWRPDVLGSEASATTHNAYCHDMHGTHIFSCNITAEASTNGYQQRNGTRSYNNSYIGNTYGGNMGGTGIIRQPLYASYNCHIQALGPKAVWLIATAISVAGATTIQVDGLVSDTAGSTAAQVTISTGSPCDLINIDNPGSLSTTGTSGGFTRPGALTGTNTITLSNGVSNTQTVKAGTRGNGIQVGDRILATQSSIGNGFNFGTSDGWPAVGPPGTTGNYTYAVGSNTFYVPYDKTIPAWVQVGYKVASPGHLPWGQLVNGTIASISADRRSFTTVENTSSNIVAGGAGQEFTAGYVRKGNTLLPQDYFAFYDSTDLVGSMARYPLTRVGPNNIFANNESPSDSYPALFRNMACINADATGNYVYRWYRYTKTASQVFDGVNGVQPNDAMTTGFDAASQAFCSNTKSGLPGDADLATVEGYMASLSLTPTKDAFYAACKLQQKGSWDSRFTANAFNNYIRGIFGVAPLTITYPAYDYNTAT